MLLIIIINAITSIHNTLILSNLETQVLKILLSIIKLIRNQ